MPCRDYSYDDNGAEDIARLREQNDKLARVACSFATAWRDGLSVKGISKEAAEWWVAHQKADMEAMRREAERQGEEQAKQKALDKLTKTERKLLGI